MAETSVLFVCLGNICRSPIAEGVFRALLEKHNLSHSIRVDSAGTSGYHEGELPDVRSMEICTMHGLDLSGQRSRAVRDSDFEDFEWIVAMDSSNLKELKRRAPTHCVARIVRILDYGDGGIKDVPDPYYGGRDGFENVYRMLVEALEPFLGEVSSGLR